MTKSNTWCDSSDRWILACKEPLWCQWQPYPSVIGSFDPGQPTYETRINRFVRWMKVSWDNLKMWDAYHSGLWQAPWGLRTATKGSSIFETRILQFQKLTSRSSKFTWSTGTWNNFEASSPNHVACQRTHCKYKHKEEENELLFSKQPQKYMDMI